MKRITFLLLSFLMAVLYPNPVSAQNSTLTLSVSDTPLNEILNKIEKKTSYSFQYSTQVIDVRQKRSIHVKNQPIEAVLNILLKGTDIQYHIKGKQIILNARKKETKKAPEKSKGIVMDSKTREPQALRWKEKRPALSAISTVVSKLRLRSIRGFAFLIWAMSHNWFR